MSAAVTGSLQTAVNWSVTGAGSISASGVYTAPEAMPANRAVTIQATLASNPAITSSYGLNFVNPVPLAITVAPSASTWNNHAGYADGNRLRALDRHFSRRYCCPVHL